MYYFARLLLFYPRFLFNLSYICIFLLCGCASYKIPTQAFQQMPMDVMYTETDIENKKEALSHWLYHVIPRHRCQIRWYDIPHWTTWMLFGNDDDGIFGEEPTARYCPSQKIGFSKATAWNLRNPLHNFCFYVIGSADRSNSEFTLLKITPDEYCLFKYYPEAKKVFASEKTSFYMALHGGKPFVSLRIVYNATRKGDFYFGWRERGNFGIKFVPFGKRKQKKGSF